MNPLDYITLLNEIMAVIQELKESGELAQLETAGLELVSYVQGSAKAQILLSKVEQLIQAIPTKGVPQ